jgi:hypothetical protein
MPSTVTTPRAMTRHDEVATYADELQLYQEWADAWFSSSMPPACNGISTLRMGAVGNKDATCDSHCRQWPARSDNEGASVALNTSGSATQGQALTTLNMETTTGPRR